MTDVVLALLSNLLATFSNNDAVATVFLLIFAGILYFCLDLFVEWRRSVRDNRRKVQHHLRIVQRSALPLLHELRKHIVLPDYKSKPDQLENLCFRIVHFLSSVRFFNKHTYDLERSPELDAADYFLSNKIPLMLRGNLYRDKKLDTETQEVLASALYSDKDASPFDFNILVFKETLPENLLFKEGCAAVARYLDYKDIDLDGDIDLESASWRSYATICHLFVYLADFYMNSTDLSIWEEYRVYCVNVVRAFGNDRKRARPLHLYRFNDLNNGYESTLTQSGYTRARVMNHFGLARLVRARGRRQADRHGVKIVSDSGLTWKEATRTTAFRYGADRSDIRKALAARISNT